MVDDIGTVFRDFNNINDPASGEYEPEKPRIRGLLRSIRNSSGLAITRNTLAALTAVTPPTEDYMGIVLDDPDPSNNGYYSRVAAAWVWERGFPDTFARVTLGGTANAQTGSVAAGVDPASTEVFFATVGTANTGPMTLSIDGETARDVVNAAGNALSAGEWTGTVIYFLNGDGDYQLLIDAGAAASAAASATAAEASRIAAEAARDAAIAAGANEFAATRTALKALDTSSYGNVYLTEAGREGQFKFVSGDYSAEVALDTAEAIYIKADDTAASVGAWVRQGAWATDGIAATWAGVVADDPSAKAANSTALQAAIDLGYFVNLPAGTVTVAYSQDVTLEGGTTRAVIRMRPGKCRLRGVPGQSILKLADNESSDGAPIYGNFIAVNELIDGLHIEGVIFDGNGANNKISPNRHRTATVTISNASPAVVTWAGHGLSVNNRVIFETTGTLPDGLDPKRRYYVKTVLDANTFTVALSAGGTVISTSDAGSGTHTAKGGSYNQFNCAALMVSGSVATTGADARLTNSKILHCQVINTAGVTCIALGQSNTNSGGGGSGATLGNNVEIAHCRFYNNGLDADDHSSVYMWCNGVHVHHCMFDHPTMSSGIDGPFAAFELHGSHNYFTQNIVNNYQWGGYIAGNWTDVSRGQFILDNDFFTAKKGVIAFVNLATEPGMQDIHIKNNRFWLSADFQGEFGFDSSTTKKCLDLRPEFGTMRDVYVSGNIIKTFDDYGAIAIDVGCYSPSYGISNVNVSDNVVNGFAQSIRVGIIGGGTVLDFAVKNNQIVEARTNTLNPTETTGIIVQGPNDRGSVRGNTFSKASGRVTVGVLLSGTMTHLDMGENHGAEIDVYQESLTVQGYRTGRQALTFTALPAQGTWEGTEYVHIAEPLLLGTTPDKYIVFGWQRMASGVGHVLNTDWIEHRSGSTGL